MNLKEKLIMSCSQSLVATSKTEFLFGVLFHPRSFEYQHVISMDLMDDLNIKITDGGVA